MSFLLRKLRQSKTKLVLVTVVCVYITLHIALGGKLVQQFSQLTTRMQTEDHHGRSFMLFSVDPGSSSNKSTDELERVPGTHMLMSQDKDSGSSGRGHFPKLSNGTAAALVRTQNKISPMFTSPQDVPSLSSLSSNKTVDISGVDNNRLKSNITDHNPKTDRATLDLLRKARAVSTVTIAARSFFKSDHPFFHPPPADEDPEFPDVLISPRVCGDQDAPPFLVVMVLSSYRANGASEREAIRETYGSVARGGQWPGGAPLLAPFTLLFLLGRPPSPVQQRQVQEESGQWGDLLVSDFVDSYFNLTVKVLSGLHWSLTACPSARFFLKADDDTFINLPLLLAFLDHRKDFPLALYGHLYLHSNVLRRGRWRVSRKDYPISIYPPYMSGTSYAMSRDAAQVIVQASSSVPHIPVEDAFITGILAEVAHVTRYATQGFTSPVQKTEKVCDFIHHSRLVSIQTTARDKNGLWNDLAADDCDFTDDRDGYSDGDDDDDNDYDGGDDDDDGGANEAG